jgi:Ferritin-like domain
MQMTPDPRALGDLLEESEDLQADAQRAIRQPLDELVDVGKERRAHPSASDPGANQAFAAAHRRSLQHGLGGAALLGAAGGGLLLGLLASPAFASSSPDIQMLQTAASIENLAVSTYGTALTLPYIGGSAANPVVMKFAQVTRSQHQQHLAAFNAAVKRLGGKAQSKPDPAFVPVVKKAVASLSGASASAGALGVVALALELENVAAETYVNDVTNLHDTQSKALTASIMGVEAQHVSVLLAVQALLKGGAPQLIALSPTNVANLPAAAGSVGFPNAFYPTSQAAPKNQGAVQ